MGQHEEVKYSVGEKDAASMLQDLYECLDIPIPYNEDQLVMANAAIAEIKKKITGVINLMESVWGWHNFD